MNAIYIPRLRSLKHFVRPKRADRLLAATAAVPAGVGLRPGAGIPEGRAGQLHQQFIVLGVITMTVLFSSMFSGIGLIWDRKFGFLKGKRWWPRCRASP